MPALVVCVSSLLNLGLALFRFLTGMGCLTLSSLHAVLLVVFVFFNTSYTSSYETIPIATQVREQTTARELEGEAVAPPRERADLSHLPEWKRTMHQDFAFAIFTTKYVYLTFASAQHL